MRRGHGKGLRDGEGEPPGGAGQTHEVEIFVFIRVIHGKATRITLEGDENNAGG